MCSCCSSKQTAAGITQGWILRCDSASLTILRAALLSFPQLLLKHLSVIHRICWPSSRCNHSLCSLSFATSTPPCWSLLSLSLSHIFGHPCGEIVAWQGLAALLNSLSSSVFLSSGPAVSEPASLFLLHPICLHVWGAILC